MKSGVAEKKAEEKVEAVVRCSCCGRKLRNPSEGIRSSKSVMCTSCYESLLNPFPERCSCGALI